MRENNEEKQPSIDPNLDTPGEAATQKHINFLDTEQDATNEQNNDSDDWSRQRKEEWQKGIEEGKKLRDTQ